MQSELGYGVWPSIMLTHLYNILRFTVVNYFEFLDEKCDDLFVFPQNVIVGTIALQIPVLSYKIGLRGFKLGGHVSMITGISYISLDYRLHACYRLLRPCNLDP